MNPLLPLQTRAEKYLETRGSQPGEGTPPRQNSHFVPPHTGTGAHRGLRQLPGEQTLLFLAVREDDRAGAWLGVAITCNEGGREEQRSLWDFLLLLKGEEQGVNCNLVLLQPNQPNVQSPGGICYWVCLFSFAIPLCPSMRPSKSVH